MKIQWFRGYVGGIGDECGDRWTAKTTYDCVRPASEKGGMGKQTVRQAARLAASGVQAERRRERADRDRRLEKLAVAMPAALLGERTRPSSRLIGTPGHALKLLIEARSSVANDVQWCADQITTREVTRLRRLAGRVLDHLDAGGSDLGPPGTGRSPRLGRRRLL